MANNYKNVELFGGAISAKVPESFGDVSDIRQVPDNQEVYLSTTGFTSLTIDLCEHITDHTDHVSALKYHFSDIVAEGDTSRIWTTDANVTLPHFPNNTPILTLLATTTPTPADSGGAPARQNTPTEVAIFLTLIRLEAQMTDMLVVLNIPHVPGGPEAAAREAGEEVDFEKGVFGSAVEEGREVLGEVLGNLMVKDWGLFGPGG